MIWPTLLSDKRFEPSGFVSEQIGSRKHVRAFQEDIDSIIYSSAFRRLQGKTQVHPFPTYDYLRTRLTHTLEVSHVGRLIATCLVYEDAIPLSAGLIAEDIGDIVCAGCLAHDLGNPPFGHLGEEAIQAWFKSNETNSHISSVLAQQDRKNDFLAFDGNAQGFRILTRLSPRRQKGGMRLTYAVLGVFSKYPYSSEYVTGDSKKFGFMQQDADAANKIFGGLGLKKKDGQEGVTGGRYARHPLAYVVEAADDICYLTTDLEDAHRLDIFGFYETASLLKSVARTGEHYNDGTFEKITNENPQDGIAYLRAAAVSTFIDNVVATFCNNKNKIMDGNFNTSLIKASDLSEAAKTIERVCKTKLYVDGRKLQLETSGHQVINGLMDLYGTMILDTLNRDYDTVNDMSRRNWNLYQLLPKEFRSRLIARDPYESMLVLVDYISGMTDRYALDLFQRLTGTSPALGRMA